MQKVISLYSTYIWQIESGKSALIPMNPHTFFLHISLQNIALHSKQPFSLRTNLNKTRDYSAFHFHFISELL